MKFLKLKWFQDRRRKLSPVDIYLIRIMFEYGISRKNISRAFVISESLVSYYTNVKYMSKVKEFARKRRKMIGDISRRESDKRRYHLIKEEYVKNKNN